MNKKYKYLFATAAIATLVVPAVASADGGFKDINSTAYFAEAVNSLTERGIINRYKEANTFRPYANITRGQAVEIIAGVAGLDTENVKNPNFKDVPTTHQFYGAIAALANAGIIQGNVDTQTFKPNEPMTRHQMAKVIALAFKLPASNKELPFTDVSSHYEDHVKALFEHGITTGTTPTTFAGSDYVKRGQLAALVYRAEAANKQVAENGTFEGEIAAISSNTMTINNKVYDIPGALQQLVNEKNALALEGALVKGTLKDGVVESITSITIKKASTKKNPVVLQDVTSPVASLSPVAKANFMPTLIIKTPYIEMTGFSLNTLNITSTVQDMKLASIQITQLNIEAEAEPTIHGDATIQQAQIASANRVILRIIGRIAILNVTVPRAAIEIGNATNIGNVVTTNGQAASAVITNYADIIANIANENGLPLAGVKPTPGSSTPSTGGGTTTLTQAAPTSLAGVAPTVIYNDGKITGTTTEMEYRLNGASTFTPASASEIINLVPGTYEVRLAAKTGYAAGAITQVIVPAPDYTTNSTISLTTASFDMKTASQADVTTTLNFGKNADNTTATVTAVKVGAATLTAGTDYTLDGTTLTIKKEYLASKAVGPVAVSVEFSAGTAATLAIAVADTTDYTSNSTISSTTASFDKKTSSQADVTTTVTFGKNADNTTATVTAVKVGAATLTEGTDYILSGNTLTIKKEFLAKQAVGPVAISVEFSAGTAVQITITVADTTDYTTNSTLSATTASFDKKTTSQADVATNVTFGKNTDNTIATVTSVKVGTETLTAGTDYTLDGTTLTIKKEYLATQAVGPVVVSVEFSAGTAVTLKVTVSDTPSWIDPIISNVHFLGLHGSYPITNGKFTGWNSGSRSGSIELSFTQPQTFSKVKLTGYAEPDSMETYTLYDEAFNLIGQKTQMVYGMSTFEIPVISGTYSKITIVVEVGTGQSWVNIEGVLLGQ